MRGRIQLSDRFALGAAALAAFAAATGLLTGIYRDVPAMVDQAQPTDLATLAVGVPALLLGLWLERSGWAGGRFVALGVVGYLAYTYAIFSFSVTINPLTPVYIAILGLATWSLLLAIIAFVEDGFDLDVGERLPRRSTAAILIASALAFAALWLGQIAGAITSGVLPASVTVLGLPTSPVYGLDLAFSLPVTGLAGVLLFRRDHRGPALSLAALTFTILIILGIVGLFVRQAAAGTAADPVVLGVFLIVGLIEVAMVVVGVLPAGQRHAHTSAAHA